MASDTLSLSTETEALVTEAIDLSIGEAFQMMTGRTVERQGTLRFEKSIEESRLGDGLTVIVALTGGLQGSVSLCFSREAALLWAREIIDHESDQLDQTVVDAAGELANIVVGGCKRRLARFDLTMGLPSVVRAGKKCLAFTTKVASLQVDYDYAETNFSVVIALDEKLTIGG